MPVLDGEIDNQWLQVNWQPIDQLWLGEKPSEEDFKGKFKVDQLRSDQFRPLVRLSKETKSY